MNDNITEQTEVFERIGLSGWHFTRLIKEIFHRVANLELIEDKFTPENDNSFNRQISGVVFLNGEKEMMITISMSFNSATALIANMTNIPLAEIKLGEQADGIEEIANMMAGQTKAMLASMGTHYKYMQPFTIVGDNHHILQKTKVSSLNLKYRSGAVEIVMTVSVQ